MTESYLNELNNKQKEAVLCTEGPLLIIAGAGAGKTKTLTHRMLHIIKKGLAPEKILAITFTNKAAKEMRERVSTLIEKDRDFNLPISQTSRPFVSTFHTLGVYIIREQAHLLNLPRHFSIYDRSDSKSTVTEAIKQLGYNPKEYEPNKILGIISREKGNMVTREEYEASAHNDFMKTLVAQVWQKYESALKKEKALDFDDLLLETALLLQRNEQVRNYYQNKWSYIHIDEYQDTNAVQYTTAKLLAGKHHNICVVGDVDQNIYSWRGATIKNIMNFEQDYPESKEITLEQNYRSTQTILAVANSIIEKNVMRKKKILFTENKEGEKVTLYNAVSEADEAWFVASKAQELVSSHVPANEIAVLYRANFQSRVLEEALLGLNVPYQVLGTRFFDRKEIKDVIYFIKSAINPEDISSLKRIINVPPRGIGKVTFLKVAEGNEDKLTGSTKEKVLLFRKKLAEINNKVQTSKPSEVIKFVLTVSGMEDLFRKTGGEEGVERLENVKELATLATKYDEMEFPTGVLKLLEDAALASDQDTLEKDNGGVKLMTVHSSKGLEFDYVFITGLEEGLFPHDRFDTKKEDEEEERRLFYVALTRARKKIFLSYAGIRTIFGSQQVNIPSQFIGDIDEFHIDNGDRPDSISQSVKNIFIDF